jgi:hypothetical protein
MWEITIYHKSGTKWVRYNLEASFRNTSVLNRNKTGVSTGDNALIRVFDVAGYENAWNCSKGDIIVNKSVSDTIVSTPLTELQSKYGKDNVYQVQSIDKNVFGEELDHIKIGAR